MNVCDTPSGKDESPFSKNAVAEGSALVLQRKARAAEAARLGLDFLRRFQIADTESADHGRYPNVYDISAGRVLSLSTNWTTGTGVSAMLLGYRFFGDEGYLKSAGRGISYLRSLQEFSPLFPGQRGIFREATPQSVIFHPRDALTAAWALLDWSRCTGDDDAKTCALAYADWFISSGMGAGYPRWTVGMNQPDMPPYWYGSFHSGSAFFLCRAYAVGGRSEYLDAAKRILSVYNELMLERDGRVRVVVDINTRKPLEDHQICQKTAPLGWVRMHEYNDDFGALANLEMWRVCGGSAYLEAAERFLAHMLRAQRQDGGFGPSGAGGFSIPPAGGSVLLEMLAARALGSSLPLAGALERACEYVMGLQTTHGPGDALGAFNGYDNSYAINPGIANIRAGSYAIIALLHYAGVDSPIYFAGSGY